MNSFLGFLLFSLAAIELAVATSPPIRIFSKVPITQDTKNVVGKVLKDLKPFFGAGRACQLTLDKIYDAKNYVAEETVYLFELKLKTTGPRCIHEAKICSGVKVFIPAPHNCDDPSGECFVLFKSEEIQCIPDLIVEPIVTEDKKMLISNPNNNIIIKDIAQEAIKFLYYKFDTSVSCPLHLKEIISATEQEVQNGLDFEFEIQIETNGADFDCEYVVQNCAKLKVHQPRLNLCPGNKSCLIPQQLNSVNCIKINQIQF